MMMAGKSRAEIEAILDPIWARREAYWLDELSQLNSGPSSSGAAPTTSNDSIQTRSFIPGGGDGGHRPRIHLEP